mgnify:FL=1
MQSGERCGSRNSMNKKRKQIILKSLLFLCLLLLCCGEEEIKHHSINKESIEWIPFFPFLNLVKEEYDYTIRKGGCALPVPSGNNISSLENYRYNFVLVDSLGVEHKKFYKEKYSVVSQKWSPMGNKVCYILRTVPLTFKVIDTSGNTVFEDSDKIVKNYSWAFNGSNIIISARGRLDTRSKLYLISLDGSSINEFKDEGVNTFGVSLSFRNQIAYAYGIFNYTTIAIINLDGTGKQVVDTCKGATPLIQWSPDGSKVIYACWFDSLSSYSILEYNAETHSKRKLIDTQNSSINSLRFSYDGTLFSYGNDSGLFIMNSDGATVNFILTKISDCSWSHSSNKIAYIDRRDSLRFQEFPPAFADK